LAGHVVSMVKKRNAYRALVATCNVVRMWQDNIIISLREMAWGYGLDLSGLW
jgi:hypothetical protein